MAIRNIIKEGDEVLRNKSREVLVFDERLKVLLCDMVETMIKANGAGLAAVQVGILKRACVVSIDGGETVFKMVNPVITSFSGNQCGLEGCLSIPNASGYVKRPKKITVEYFDENGVKMRLKAEGYLAVACCHELDHLDGVLFTDKIEENYKDKK